ncbi:MAG: hypothetical protein Q9222_007234 [Ikaeria aurantiellina]
MQLDKTYAFRQRDTAKVTAHTRLVVGHIFKEDPNDDTQKWDFEAYSFHMVLAREGRRPLDDLYGGRCEQVSGSWDCRDSALYKFKGEVGIQYFEEIDEQIQGEAQALIDQNNCYSLLTNNCKQFASKLFKRIEGTTPAGSQPAIGQPFDMQVQFAAE